MLRVERRSHTQRQSRADRNGLRGGLKIRRVLSEPVLVRPSESRFVPENANGRPSQSPIVPAVANQSVSQFYQSLLECWEDLLLTKN